MTTDTQRILILNRLVNDAENSAYAAELELAAAQAELLQLREAMEGQQELIDAQRNAIAAHQHAAVCMHQEYQAVVAERDALVGRLMGAVVTWVPEGSAN